MLSGDVVGDGGGVFLLLAPPSLLLLLVVSLSVVLGGDGRILPILSPLLALAPVVLSLDSEPVLPPSLLLFPIAVDGVGVPSDLCFFLCTASAI